MSLSEAEKELRQKEAGARPEIIPKETPEETPEEMAQRVRRERILREQERERDHP